MPSFVGNANFAIYFGTKFDLINVPYTKELLRQEATKTLNVTGQVIWQSTWLTTVRVNVTNYQDIVGAQYLEILEDGATDYGSHFYMVLGYQQLSRKTCELTLMYDAILSIGITHITGITGIINRWTVDNDSQYKYVMTPEPLNQGSDYTYSYSYTNAAKPTLNANTIVGFAVDMDNEPTISVYDTIETGYSANIYYPDLTPIAAGDGTQFRSYIPDMCLITDGMQYYRWIGQNSSTVRQNYSYATGLGYDLVTQSYILPDSDLITISENNGKIALISGGTSTFSTGLSTTDGSYRNQKAREMGIYFTLFNPVSGDSVTVQNYDIGTATGTVSLTLMCNPYINGCFLARINGYLSDNNITGIVKSAGYLPLTLSANMPANYQSNLINYTQQVDSLVYNTIYQSETLDINQSYNAWENIGTALDGLLTGVGAGAIAMGQTGAIAGALQGSGGVVSGIVNTIKSAETTSVNFDYLYNQVTAQANYLRQIGNIGRSTPPAVKYANASFSSSMAYSFGVRKTTLSTSDRQRLDNFFTAYGYNVDHTALTSHTQLHCREKFTFIMADEVNITSVYETADLSRLRDPMTQTQIKERFAAGLRIWTTSPNYDWSTVTNPIV